MYYLKQICYNGYKENKDGDYMRRIIYNYDNLVDSDINEIVIRMKILLINNGNIILGNERNIYQFPGGHLEENETFNDCIKREVLEETGIVINDSQIKEPIFEISYYNKDYPQVGINRKSVIYYYIVETSETPNLENTNYTEHEKNGQFNVQTISLDEVINVLENNILLNEKNKVIVPEMVMVLKEYFNKLQKDKYQTRIINDDNLSDSDIDEVTTRSRAIIKMDNDDILMCYSKGLSHYEFPGGHLEIDETILEGLVRELKEETGIVVEEKDIIPFYAIKYYCKNYHGTEKNRLVEIYYSIVNTNNNFDYNNRMLDIEEEKEDYICKYININDLEEKLIRNKETTKENNSSFDDMIYILREYKSKLEN